MLIATYKAFHLGFWGHAKYRGCRVIHRAGCGAQPTHPRPALWITRIALYGLEG
jgi:hypothetical protein